MWTLELWALPMKVWSPLSEAAVSTKNILYADVQSTGGHTRGLMCLLGPA